MTFWETVERGEYVMIALAVVLIAIVVIWWVRGAALRRERRGYQLLMQRVRDHVSEGDLENAHQICQSSSTPGCRVLDAGLKRIGQPIREVRWAVEAAVKNEYPDIDKGAFWLRILAVVAPLAGLGGTLVGVIDRLRDLGEQGVMTDAATIGGAIAPTIVTTVAGLGVGIFSLIAYACLNSSILTARRKLDNLALEFTNFLEEPSR